MEIASGAPNWEMKLTYVFIESCADTVQDGLWEHAQDAMVSRHLPVTEALGARAAGRRLKAPIGEAGRFASPIGFEANEAGIVDGGAPQVEQLEAVAAGILNRVPQEEGGGVHVF